MVEIGAPPGGPDEELATLSILQELTVASLALFDPEQSLDVFLERIAARLGSPVTLCLEIGLHGSVGLLGDAGLSTSSRALPVAPWSAVPPGQLPAALLDSLPFPEVCAPALTQWHFQLAAPEADAGAFVWLVLVFERTACPPAVYRPVIQRLTTTLRAALRQREAAAALLATTTRLAAANDELRHEIEERKRAEDALLQTEGQLRQAQKMEAIGRLAGGLAHDFNNLLMVIGGCSAVLKKQVPADAPMREPVELIAQAAAQAGTLTHQLLAFSRQQVLHPCVVDLNALVTDTQSMLQRLIGDDIEIVCSLDPDVGPVRADPGQIVQILMNLTVNARDSMPGGGTLTMATRNARLDDELALDRLGIPAGRYVMLAVSDTGVGMDAPTQARAFEPFFTTKDVGKGTGLGLSTVYGIVKQSGGAIRVDSEVGRGSTFQVYLPRADELRPPSSLPRGGAPESRRGAETVLVVEDNPMVRDLVQTFVSNSGYTALVASGGEEAIEISERHTGPIDVLITDVTMPRMSGGSLAMRLLESRPQMKVILISGFSSDPLVGAEVLRRRALFLQKPFTEEALVEKLDQARGRR